MGDKFTVSKFDILGMIGIRSQQIVASVAATAAGATPPSVDALRHALTGMMDLVDGLEAFPPESPN